MFKVPAPYGSGFTLLGFTAQLLSGFLPEAGG